MKSFDISEARVRFPRLLKLVEKGEEVEITRHGRPIAKVVPLRRKRTSKAQLEKTLTELRKFRETHPLGDLTIRQMIKEGRRY